MRLRARAALAAALALGVAQLPAQAWGPEGHRIIGMLAERQLTPAAAAAVAELLAGEPEPTLAGVANWADETRTADSGPLHYVNFPRGSCAYVPARDCPDGRCVIGAIEQATAVLADPAAAVADRRVALKNLVHFVGDLHQPLHAGHGDDRGGNTVAVGWRGADRNLHQVWDSLLIEAIEPDPARWVQRLKPSRAAAAASADEARQWARESCAIVATRGFYPASGTPDAARYQRRWAATVDTRLQRAGRRLAGLLNRALGQRRATASAPADVRP